MACKRCNHIEYLNENNLCEDCAELLALRSQLASLVAENDLLTDKLHKRQADDHVIEQTLGKALDYPWYRDDQKNFPGSTELDGVCTGEHVPETLAVEASNTIKSLRSRVSELEAALERINSGLSNDMLGTVSLERDDMRAIAAEALRRSHD